MLHNSSMAGSLKEFLRKLSPSLWVAMKLIKHSRDENSWLTQTGFVRSIKEGRPCRNDGSPLPWMNYSMIEFLDNKLRNNMDLFEYGCGQSTRYFAGSVRSVCSVEHEPGWYERISSELSDNVSIRLVTEVNKSDYANACWQGQKSKFDIIVIDGIEREACIFAALKGLKDDGVILLDDSDRFHGMAVTKHLHDSGFRSLIFSGLKPTGYARVETSLFYRNNNCFNL